MVLAEIPFGPHDFDDPMAAFSSLPHVPHHEVGRCGCLEFGTREARMQTPTPPCRAR
jgi:hypothetical protein